MFCFGVEITHMRDCYSYLYFSDFFLGGGARPPMARNAKNRSGERTRKFLLVGFIISRASSESVARQARDFSVAIFQRGAHQIRS